MFEVIGAVTAFDVLATPSPVLFTGKGSSLGAPSVSDFESVPPCSTAGFPALTSP